MAGVATAIAGVGLGVAGFFKSSSAAKKAAAIQKKISKQEILIQEENKKAMELDAYRRKLEVFRAVQRAQSVAQANAVAQGASLSSSGVMGGMFQSAASGASQILGISQSLEIGRQIFQYQKNISGLKMQLADANAQMQVGAGLSSLGNSLLSNAASIGKMASGFGS